MAMKNGILCYDLAMRDFGNHVFEGTAKYYAKYRLSYPDKLIQDIVSVFNLDGRGKLLDLGCGTGELTIPLSKHFDSVIAWDPDKEMLLEGIKKAKKAHANNIKWHRASSKNLEELKTSLRLVSMGGSFHWMQQDVVLNLLFSLITPGGGVAITGGAKPLEFGSETSDKNKIIQGVIKKYLGPDRRAGEHVYRHPEKSFEDYLKESKFQDFQEHYYKIEVTRSVDQIIGSLFSTSFASKKQLGSQAEAFENELRHKLVAFGQASFSESFEISLLTAHKRLKT